MEQQEPTTAFELYLREHPEEDHQSRTQPVVFFAPNTLREGMVDFRPKVVNADAEDPEGYAAHIAPVAPPKGWSVVVSAPTSRGSEPEQGENPVPPNAVKESETPEPPADQTVPVTTPTTVPIPPGQQVKTQNQKASGTSAPTTTG